MFTSYAASNYFMHNVFPLCMALETSMQSLKYQSVISWPIFWYLAEQIQFASIILLYIFNEEANDSL